MHPYLFYGLEPEHAEGSETRDELAQKLQEAQTALAHVRERSEQLEAELGELQEDKAKVVQDSVEFQMEAQEEADRLQKGACARAATSRVRRFERYRWQSIVQLRALATS